MDLPEMVSWKTYLFFLFTLEIMSLILCQFVIPSSESIPHIHSRVKGSGSAVVVDEAAKVLFNQEFERDWKQVEDHYKKGEK